MKELKPYWVKEKDAEWSVLSFNYNRQDAKVEASRHWLTEYEYIDLRVRRAKKDYMIFCEKEEPHVVDSWDHELEFDHDYPTWKEALHKKRDLLLAELAKQAQELDMGY